MLSIDADLLFFHGVKFTHFASSDPSDARGWDPLDTGLGGETFACC
jgi:hypothetical protein